MYSSVLDTIYSSVLDKLFSSVLDTVFSSVLLDGLSVEAVDTDIYYEIFTFKFQ